MDEPLEEPPVEPVVPLEPELPVEPAPLPPDMPLVPEEPLLPDEPDMPLLPLLAPAPVSELAERRSQPVTSTAPNKVSAKIAFEVFENWFIFFHSFQ